MTKPGRIARWFSRRRRPKPPSSGRPPTPNAGNRAGFESEMARFTQQ